MTEQPAALIFIEEVIWHPRAEWIAAVEHLASRFARATPLDAGSIASQPTFQMQVAALHAWAGDADVDLDRELGRWFDEHLSMHVRPDPSVTRAVRALAAAGPVHAASVLPPRVAEAIARHAGCWRSITQLHAGLEGPDTLASLIDASEPTPRIIGAPSAASVLPASAQVELLAVSSPQAAG